VGKEENTIKIGYIFEEMHIVVKFPKSVLRRIFIHKNEKVSGR
jgi:hypothetical protein